MDDALYSLDLLTLAAGIPRLGALDAPDATSRKVSKLCGSWLELDVDVRDGRVCDAAVRLQACALGQAAAAVLMRDIVGATPAELEAARDALRAMLKDGGPAPAGRFAGLSALAEVRNYPQRHTSTLLAFEAAAEAAAGAARGAETSPVGHGPNPG
jgi:NifU-like protein involved in Fe-S cluster formation